MSILPYLNKMRKYCSYQERCESDIRTKMEKFPLRNSDKDILIDTLIKERYFDDERFAASFVRSKLKVNKWGRNKIKYALKQKRIREDLIDGALNQIDEEYYLEVLSDLAKKKYLSLKGDDTNYEKRQKTAVYLQSKGFEIALIFNCINKISRDE